MKKIIVILFFIYFIQMPLFGAENLDLARIYVNLGNLEPEFSETRTYYTLILNENIDNFILQATPKDENLKYEIKGNEDLKLGENLITITVFSSNLQDTKTYTINALVSDEPDKYNALLNTLIIDNYLFTEDFFPEIFEYTTTAATDKSDIEVFAYPQNSNASITISGNTNLKSGNNIINIDVTSENGLATRNYKINLNKVNTLNTSNQNEISVENNVKTNKFKWLVVILALFVIIVFIVFSIVFIIKHKTSSHLS